MGSIFKPKTTTVPASSSGTVTYDIPEYFKKAQEELFQRATAESKKPYQAFTGQRIADFTQAQRDAISAAGGQIGAFERSGATTEARGMLDEMKRVGQRTFTGSTVDEYMNPYIENVVNRSVSRIADMESQRRNQAAKNQITAGAYGGSRGAIEQAVGAAESARTAGDLAAGLYAQGFNTARGAFDQDRSVQMQNLSALTNAIPALQLQKQGAAMTEAEGAMKFGAAEQGLEQARLNEAYKDFIEQQGFGRGQLAFLTSILSGAPIRSYGQASTGTQDQVIGGTSPFAQIAGTAMAFANPASDVRLKRDIELVGKSPSGINVYNFKYLNSDDTYQGVMAQEVPEASVLINNYYHVDYSKVDVEFKKLS